MGLLMRINKDLSKLAKIYYYTFPCSVSEEQPHPQFKCGGGGRGGDFNW